MLIFVTFAVTFESTALTIELLVQIKTPYLARGLHVWLFVATRTEYSFNR